jgi:hypothetical protein
MGYIVSPSFGHPQDAKGVAKTTPNGSWGGATPQMAFFSFFLKENN